MGNYKIYIKEKVLKIYAAQTVHCALVDIQFFAAFARKKEMKGKPIWYSFSFYGTFSSTSVVKNFTYIDDTFIY